MARLFSAIFSRKWLVLALAGGAVLVLGLGAMCSSSIGVIPPESDPKLTTPILAIEALTANSLYYNGAARRWLLLLRPELVNTEEKDANSERSRALAQAVQSSQVFRQLDRRARFDTVLLVGDPSEYHPLLQHLLETKDWTLSYLDHTSLVFKRTAARAWQPSDLGPIRKHFGRKQEAVFLAQAATKMLAVRMSAPAKELLDAAETLDPKAVDVWNGLAIYRMNRGEWSEALSNADRALALRPAFLPAVASKTQILFSTRKFDEALTLSAKLLAAHPDDPGLLFYHAKIAHERHAYGDEIDALRKLITLAEQGSRPTSGYRIYLAQAHAARSEAEPAIAEFSRALADPELSKEQRRFAEELLTQIKTRSGL